MSSNILAIDPGKYKSGLAVLLEDGAILERKVVKTLELQEAVSELSYKYQPQMILLGNSGQGKIIEKKISYLNLKTTILFVNEKGSTLEARKLYWEENRPKGLWRLVPSGLRLPPEPYDDYAAVIIGRRYLDK
jgi:RNase H-fold protein (predicted Holliday junction resolvase)